MVFEYFTPNSIEYHTSLVCYHFRFQRKSRGKLLNAFLFYLFAFLLCLSLFILYLHLKSFKHFLPTLVVTKKSFESCITFIVKTTKCGCQLCQLSVNKMKSENNIITITSLFKICFVIFLMVFVLYKLKTLDLISDFVC